MKIQRATTRRGTVLIAVLVCMGIAVTIVLGAVQSSLRQRRQLRQELQLEQTRWLMDAGVSKAISEVQSQPNYKGATLPSIQTFEKYPGSSVKISVIGDDQDDRVRLLVTARLGTSEQQGSTMQRSKEFVVKRRQVE